MTDTDRDLAVIADYMRRRGAVPLPAGLMAAAQERTLRQAPERDTARASLAAFWTRGPVAIAGALGALATVAVLLVVLSGLPLGGTDAPAADPSPGGQPSSSPAASPSSTVVCGQVEADACQTAIALVRGSHPREVADASAIVVDDTCPPDATCLAWGGFLEYPFEVAVVPSASPPRPPPQPLTEAARTSSRASRTLFLIFVAMTMKFSVELPPCGLPAGERRVKGW
jgi:hypothetical protein